EFAQGPPPVEKLPVDQRHDGVPPAGDDLDRRPDGRQQITQDGQALRVRLHVAHRLGEALALVRKEVGSSLESLPFWAPRSGQEKGRANVSVPDPQLQREKGDVLAVARGLEEGVGQEIRALEREVEVAIDLPAERGIELRADEVLVAPAARAQQVA